MLTEGRVEPAVIVIEVAQSTTEPQNHLLLLACFSGKIFKRTAGDFKEWGGDGGRSG